MPVYDEETMQRLLRVQSLSARIEKPAEETEMAIWRELLAGHQAKKVEKAGRTQCR